MRPTAGRGRSMMPAQQAVYEAARRRLFAVFKAEGRTPSRMSALRSVKCGGLGVGHALTHAQTDTV